MVKTKVKEKRKMAKVFDKRVEKDKLMYKLVEACGELFTEEQITPLNYSKIEDGDYLGKFEVYGWNLTKIKDALNSLKKTGGINEGTGL